MSLKDGLRINDIKLVGFQIRGLYIKLDKKLTLQADYIHVPTAKKRSDIRTIPVKIKRYLKFIEYLDIKDVEFANDHYRIVFSDKTIYIVNDEYEFAGNIKSVKDRLEVEFPVLFIKRFKGSLKGVFSYDYTSKKIKIDGVFSIQGTNGRYRVVVFGNRLDFYMQTDRSSRLGSFVGILPIPPATKSWLKDRLKASSFIVSYLFGSAEMEKKGLKLDIASLNGKMRLDKASLRFNDRLHSVDSEEVDIRLYRKGLYLDFKKIGYNGKAIDGSRAAIVNLGSKKKLSLLLRLKYTGKFDQDIKKILSVYEVDLDLLQKKGKSVSEVDIDIPLNKNSSKKIALKGKSSTGKSLFSFEGVDFYTRGGWVAYTSREMAFNSLKISNKNFKGTVKGRVDLIKKRGFFDVDCKKFSTSGKDPILMIRNRKFKLNVVFGKKITFAKIPFLKTKIFKNTRNGKIEAKLKDLSLYRQFLSYPFSWIDGGSMKFESGKKNSISFNGNIVWKSSPFYSSGGPVTRFGVGGRIDRGELYIETKKRDIIYDSSKNLIVIDNLNVDAKKLGTLLKAEKKSSSFVPKKLTISGNNSKIKYDKYILLTNRYKLNMIGDKVIFSGELGKDRVEITKNGDDLKISAKNIGDRMLHALIHFKGLYGGRYTISIHGNITRDIKGSIHIDGGVIRDFKAYNDLIALFNTIPALIAFSSPGFSSKGFVIKKGDIVFRIRGDMLYFEKIEFIGKSSTIVGNGKMNIKSKVLDMDLGIQTAREVGKSVGSLPILGYIIFGKDKSLTTGVKITGTLDKPKVKTNPIGQALLYPLQLLRRTITAPASLGGTNGSNKSNKRKNETKKSTKPATPADILSNQPDTF